MFNQTITCKKLTNYKLIRVTDDQQQSKCVNADVIIKALFLFLNKKVSKVFSHWHTINNNKVKQKGNVSNLNHWV